MERPIVFWLAFISFLLVAHSGGAPPKEEAIPQPEFIDPSALVANGGNSDVDEKDPAQRTVNIRAKRSYGYGGGWGVESAASSLVGAGWEETVPPAVVVKKVVVRRPSFFGGIYGGGGYYPGYYPGYYWRK